MYVLLSINFLIYQCSSLDGWKVGGVNFLYVCMYVLLSINFFNLPVFQPDDWKVWEALKFCMYVYVLCTVARSQNFRR